MEKTVVLKGFLLYTLNCNEIIRREIMQKKFVYLFKEGSADMKNLLGGKGANLSQMTSLGLPVPQGFTVTTEACNKYYVDGEKLTPEVEKQIFVALKKIESETGKVFGDAKNPLLVSVRSGSRASMPGMMDTILNLGLNDKVVEGLATLTGNVRFAYDSYRRFIQMFADVVMGIKRELFEDEMDKIKVAKGVTKDTDLNDLDLKNLVIKFKKIYAKHKGEEFPEQPNVQLIEAVKAVFRSWNNERAIAYRRMNDIPAEWGTAVNIQSMVFGNMGDESGTGVAFTRNPATGEKALFGEYLMNAQGEDVVAGIRTPNPIIELEKQNPAVFKEFVDICDKLEDFYKDMQDMEFTIENGKLYMLQTRNGKRTATAALKIAIDLVSEGKISKKEALMKIEPRSLDSLLHPTFKQDALKKAKVLSHGLAASPGAGCGIISISPKQAMKCAERKIQTILVRTETSPEDIEGMAAATGVLTATGGMTSHAAVVARGMGIACVAGCEGLKIDEKNKVVTINNKSFKEGDYISIDGTLGNVYGEKIETEEASISGDFATIMAWVDEYTKLKVRANADTAKDARRAIQLGAVGIGLCRTEHMFFEKDRIKAIREMIVATNLEEREKALGKLLPMQKGDFYKLFKELNGKPCTIRYIDPPLHEFLPTAEKDIAEIAKDLGKTTAELKHVIEELKEFNPMMGFRGCRLAIVIPELARMQTRAMLGAALDCKKEGTPVCPELMVPLIGDVKELQYIKDIIHATAKELMEEVGMQVDYTVGTMIEIPRAAITADKIAKEADFFSFGTNDLTQMTYGFSRDDAAKFLKEYYFKRIFESDPFVRVDEEGVGYLMRKAVSLGRGAKPTLKCGICGEHGGDPASVKFAHKIGLNYVSCSPYRVPIARLAAAQAVISESM